MILDDGGDATLFVHLGYQASSDPSILEKKPESEEERILLAQLKKSMKKDPKRFKNMPGEIRGVSEETTTGVQAAVPGDQRERLGHEVEVRQPVRLPPLARGCDQPRHGRDAGR
jgi:S-adenosylhomocysteine hydrolase